LDGAADQMSPTPFSILCSDSLLLKASLASDVRSLWRGLARSAEVRRVSRELASDPDRIREFCAWVENLRGQPYDIRFRHPEDTAICAALVILEQSPLSAVRNLFARMRRTTESSFIWVRRMAEHCDERFADSHALESYQPAPPTRFRVSRQAEPQYPSRIAELEATYREILVA
jgi:hypothetical protein